MWIRVLCDSQSNSHLEEVSCQVAGQQPRGTTHIPLFQKQKDKKKSHIGFKENQASSSPDAGSHVPSFGSTPALLFLLHS